MEGQLDNQTPIFSSYKGMNEFKYWFNVDGGIVIFTPEIRKKLKKIR